MEKAVSREGCHPKSQVRHVVADVLQECEAVQVNTFQQNNIHIRMKSVLQNFVDVKFVIKM